jgi:drug/metabolite transporter (DMT)-like permease
LSNPPRAACAALPLAAAALATALFIGMDATVKTRGACRALGRARVGLALGRRLGEASRAAPMEYTGLVWAAGLGYALFGEVPTAYSLASAGLIVGGALLLLRK